MMTSKGIQTIVQSQQAEQENSSLTSSNAIQSVDTSRPKSLWRMFSEEWLPTNILGVPVVDIKSDLREGTTQISDL